MSAIGEAGSISENTSFTGEPIQVTFTQPLTDPVIALMSTDFGGNKFSLRVIEVQTDASGEATGFTFTIDEWENHDGPHPRVEDINWIAIESGVHTLPDGRTIEAGYSDADSDGESVSLNGTFSGTPTVLTTVASDNHASNVDSDPSNITATGFDLSVEEAESQDGIHDLESVGWIAIDQGTGTDSGSALNVGGIGSSWVNNVGLGATFTNPVTVGETQTQNDPDTGNVIYNNLDSDSIDIRFEEDTSVDGDTGHIPETVGLVTFEQGLILCFTPGTRIQTPFGPRDICELGAGDLVLTEDAGPQPIRFVARRELSPQMLAACPDLRPVTIRAGALGPGLPERDLTVSPQHRMLITGWRAQMNFGTEECLCPARGLVNDDSIRVRTEPGSVTYIHLGLDEHHILRADGAPSESLHPGSLRKSDMDEATRAELLRVFPDLVTSPRGDQLARPSLTVRETSLLI